MQHYHDSVLGSARELASCVLARGVCAAEAEEAGRVCGDVCCVLAQSAALRRLKTVECPIICMA